MMDEYGYISFGNYLNIYPSMKGIIYESRFSTYPSSSWTTKLFYSYIDRMEYNV